VPRQFLLPRPYSIALAIFKTTPQTANNPLVWQRALHSSAACVAKYVGNKQNIEDIWKHMEDIWQIPVCIMLETYPPSTNPIHHGNNDVTWCTPYLYIYIYRPRMPRKTALEPKSQHVNQTTIPSKSDTMQTVNRFQEKKTKCNNM